MNRLAWAVVFGFSATLAAAAPADPQELATKAGGTFDPVSGAAMFKKVRPVDAASLTELAATGKVTALTLDGCGLGPDGLKAVAGFQGLVSLDLTHTMVNKPADLKTLAARLTRLESLNLGGSDFGDDGLAVVCGIPTLRTLHLGHVGRSPNTAFTATGLKALGGLEKLETLTLHLENPDGEMIPVLAGLKGLRYLSVGGVSKDFLAKLKAAMPAVQVRLRGSPKE